MTSISVAEAKNRFSDLLRRAEYAGERVVVRRRGKPVAAIVSTQDLARLQALEDAEDVRDAGEALEEAEERGTIPIEVVLRKHGLTHLLVERPRSTRLRHGSTRPARRRAAAKTTPKAASKKAR